MRLVPAPFRRRGRNGDHVCIVVQNLPVPFDRRVWLECRTLRAAGYLPENVVLMTQSAAARDLRFAPESAKIRSELRLLLQNRRRDDTVLIAFAGHGVQFQNDDQAYFCPADARLAEETRRYAGAPAYAANFERLGIRAEQTVMDATTFPDRIHQYRDAVDEIVLRVMVPSDSVDDHIRFVETAAELLAAADGR